jgi:hypothetical protein
MWLLAMQTTLPAVADAWAEDEGNQSVQLRLPPIACSGSGSAECVELRGRIAEAAKIL